MPASQHERLVPAGISHPQVRQFINIKRHRSPHTELSLALEGMWAIRMAADARLPLEAVFVCHQLITSEEAVHLLDRLAADGIPVWPVSERVIRRLVDRDAPDGLAAIAQLRRTSLADIVVAKTARVLVADGVEKAGNLGTIIRCADGAGASGVIVVDRRVRLTNALVVRASMGTLFSIPMVTTDQPTAVRWLRERDFRIVVADPAAALSYRSADYGERTAIVVGNERYGLSDGWRHDADCRVSIPMLGRADSLNVGHAAALLLYEALHQQGQQHDTSRSVPPIPCPPATTPRP